MLQALALRDRSQFTIVIGHIDGVKSLRQVVGGVARRNDMVAEGTTARLEMGWSDDALELRVEVDDEGVARLSRLAPTPIDKAGAGLSRDASDSDENRAVGLPLLDVVVAGSGRSESGRRYSESVVGQRMRYVGYAENDSAPWHELAVALEDPGTGLAATVSYQVLPAGGVLRSRTTLTNAGVAPLTVESVTSFLGGGLAGPGGSLADAELFWADNDWLAESRWQTRNLRDALPDLNGTMHGSRSRGRFALTSEGSWSSGTYLPMGAVVNRESGHTLLWQIEHNGGWHWQVGEHRGTGPGASYLALLGPTDSEHHWRLTLRPGESFETVPVAIALSYEGLEGAVARLTNYRRALRSPHPDHRKLPVIFNDYMNTLMGDPTTDKLRPLIAAAARAGAEYFCIDSGWYAEMGEGWWDTVGSWTPSSSRFPNGIAEVLDLIRAEGMVPGLWLEPEVVGVRSPVAEQLPLEAFFARNGERVVEQGRYHLDLSHPSAVKHLDDVVDLLVGDLGVGYLKMDYNINIGPGTEPGDVTAGVGLLAHNRGFLEWVDGLLDRHPSLTIESCASGGMRADYAMLSHCQIQSTSDQQDFLRYPAIAAAAPMAVAPEQAAVWAYPQPEWTDDEIAFTLCTALLGRVHLSGHIDRMSHQQQQLVARAVNVYKQVRTELAEAVPFWPLGLPGWTDPWVALGMRVPSTAHAYVVVWHRGPVGKASGPAGPAGPLDSLEVVLPIAHMRDRQADPKVMYPAPGAAGAEWDPERGELTAALPRTPSACLIRLG
jgi:alpha-galactosidase